MDLVEFDADVPVVGMVHLPPLPGAPGSDGDRAAIRARMRADADALEAGGVDGLLVENFGDAPFYPEAVPRHVVSELTALATELVDAVDVPVGVNVLRNDAEAALSIAAASGASFVRVNVHTGAAATDQGLVEGCAHETLRLRERIDAPVAILADVGVKHATPLADRGLARAARETVERGRADGLIVSGAATGEETPLDDLERVAAVADELDRTPPVFVGSGVTPARIDDLVAAGADGLIVGTALEEGGEAGNPVRVDRVETVVAAARAAGEE